MSQFNSLKVELIKWFLGGAVTGFIYTLLEPPNLQTALIAAFIGGVSFSIGELVSLVGNTWWLKGLLWGTTTGIIISVLIHLLLPSIDLRVMSVISGFIFYGLLNQSVNSKYIKSL